jgi:hypothetical protein
VHGVDLTKQNSAGYLSRMSARDELLAEIEAFLIKHDIRASYFGRDIVGDFSLVSRLRRGGDVRLETVDKIRTYMAAYNKTKSTKHGRRKGVALVR